MADKKHCTGWKNGKIRCALRLDCQTFSNYMRSLCEYKPKNLLDAPFNEDLKGKIKCLHFEQKKAELNPLSFN
jgi:hypothetical protein